MAWLPAGALTTFPCAGQRRRPSTQADDVHGGGRGAAGSLFSLSEVAPSLPFQSNHDLTKAFFFF